jgi:hypothetical protein
MENPAWQNFEAIRRGREHNVTACVRYYVPDMGVEMPKYLVRSFPQTDQVLYEGTKQIHVELFGSAVQAHSA